MNKVIKIILLISSVVLTTGCSKPTIHKPSFKRYGSQVPTGIFYNTYLRLYKTGIDKFIYEGQSEGGNSNTYFSNRTKIKIVQSGIVSYSSLTTSQNYTLTQQIEATSMIDPIYERYLVTENQKYYLEGDMDYFKGRLPTGSNKYYINQKSYGEVLNDTLFEANMKKHTLTTYGKGKSYARFFSFASLNAFYYLSSLSVSDSDDFKYYINGETLSIIYSTQYDTINSEGIIQVSFGKTLQYKAKAINQWQSKSSDDIASAREETYVDLTIERTIQSVKKVDYSQYTQFVNNI